MAVAATVACPWPLVIPRSPNSPTLTIDKSLGGACAVRFGFFGFTVFVLFLLSFIIVDLRARISFFLNLSLIFISSPRIGSASLCLCIYFTRHLHLD
jgi:hypothetical protein